MKQYDVNMIVETKFGNYDVDFYDVETEPFRLYGVWREGDTFCRVPKAVAETVSEGIFNRRITTSGGRVRFITDSPFIAIRAEYNACEHIDLTALSCTVGFDLYADGVYATTYRYLPEFDKELIGLKDFGIKKERLYTLNLPTHSSIKKLYVGVSKDATIKRAPDYKYEKPVVFYGSSITNGSCASRPGMIYENIISRKLDMNYHNLGFGGLAKGEPQMAEYIAGLDMSVFVMDYDHNAPTPEHLLATHEPFFKAVRAKHPDIPVIMISRPTKCDILPQTAERFNIIKRTYDNAKASGDSNVYLINGLEFFGELENECAVDGVHPTDFGFYLMANRIAEELKPLLEG